MQYNCQGIRVKRITTRGDVLVRNTENRDLECDYSHLNNYSSCSGTISFSQSGLVLVAGAPIVGSGQYSCEK